MSVLGKIEKNWYTEDHFGNLIFLGYRVEDCGDHLLVTAKGFARSGKEHIYDASTREKARKFFNAVVEGKFLLSPGTNVLIPVYMGEPSGRTEIRKRFRGPLCATLQNGPLREWLGVDYSALVAEEVE